MRLLTITLVLSGAAFAQLPDGPGKTETERICKQCHELERSISLRQDRAGWQATMDKMAALGAKGTQAEFDAVVTYLATNFPAQEIPKLNANTARAIDFESAFTLPRSQAAKIIQYREKNGDFHSFEDLKKVPGIDIAKIEPKKDRLVFK